MRIVWTSLWVVALVACKTPLGDSDSDDPGRQSTVVGIDPLVYKCADLVTVADVASALGGEVTQAQVAFEPPPGTPEPCHYLRQRPEASPEPWSFDIDCRADALATAESLFAQYRATGQAPSDAGAAAAGTTTVDIGRRAVDHRGHALLVVDDDTDCYLRVLGPSADGRQALAQLLVARLVLANAPMRPRPL